MGFIVAVNVSVSLRIGQYVVCVVFGTLVIYKPLVLVVGECSGLLLRCVHDGVHVRLVIVAVAYFRPIFTVADIRLTVGVKQCSSENTLTLTTCCT